MSKIVGCELQRQGDLPFNHISATCNTFNQDGTEKVFLCFDYGTVPPGDFGASDMKTCHRSVIIRSNDRFARNSFYNVHLSYDGTSFEQIAKSSNSHLFTVSLPKYRNQPLAVGCWWNAHAKAEIYFAETDEWVDVPDYPFHKALDAYATTSTEFSTYIFGGRDDIGYDLDTVAQYNNGWYLAGTLSQKRSESGAVSIGSQTMILGGNSENDKYERVGKSLVITFIFSLTSEIWDTKLFEVSLTEPTLESYQWAQHIVMFAVESDFCKKQ